MGSMFDAVERGARLSKEELEQRLPPIRVDLVNLQFDLRERDFPVLISLAGSDRRGCAELFQAFHEWLDARRLDSCAFEAPSEEERERPPFWRYWRALPRRGRIGLFLGEWTWQAIVRRTLGEIDDAELERRIEHAGAFERALVADGALLVKLWLHAPRAKLEKRMAAHEDGERGAWRVEPEDRAVLERYDEGLAVAERVLRASDPPAAPWHLIESSDAEHRDLTAATLMRDALRERLESGGSGRVWSGAVAPEPRRASELALASVDLSRSLPDDVYDAELERQQARVFELARHAYEAKRTSVIVLEGWDAAGKGGAIRRMMHALNAARARVVPIGAPSEEERAHHYLWRFWKELPRAGRVLVFDRSWYGRVLVERVEGFAEPEEWRRAYAEILDFERQLVEHEIVLVKLWLHLDRAEQERRFAARERTPYKKYKIGADDYRNRAKWPQYVEAADEMFQRTSWPGAPWHLVPANDKRWARVEVIRTVCDRLAQALPRDERGTSARPAP